jgi:hypothetical protein
VAATALAAAWLQQHWLQTLRQLLLRATAVGRSSIRLLLLWPHQQQLAAVAAAAVAVAAQRGGSAAE